MASFLFPFPTTINHRRCRTLAPPPIHNCATTNSMAFGVPVVSYKFKFYRSFHYRPTYWCGRCRAAGSSSEPPPEKHHPSSSGVTATLIRFKDTLQVFFAVLFWMSLFFWSSAWDGGNSGRSNKRTRKIVEEKSRKIFDPEAGKVPVLTMPIPYMGKQTQIIAPV